MSKSLRLSEKWFRRGLWLVALVFAGFLIGLGSTLVGDLPQVEHQRKLDDFVDAAAAAPLRRTLHDTEATLERVAREQEQAELAHDAAAQASSNARETFGNWLATRRATALPAQDAELVERTRALDALKGAEDEAQRRVQAARQLAFRQVGLFLQRPEHPEVEVVDLLRTQAGHGCLPLGDCPVAQR